MNQAELFYPEAPAPARPAIVPRVAPTPDARPQVEGPEAESRCAYTVRLTDYPYPSADAVKVSEQRFRRELDRQLGDDVARSLRAYRNVTESSEGDLTKEEVALASRWAKAYEAARTAGFRDLGDTDEAHFEVRPI
ncbi:hypothetical protein J7E49_12355 [Variovorax paradoxus]|nr:hypothetical protein [Variovorax paradoxus]